MLMMCCFFLNHLLINRGEHPSMERSTCNLVAGRPFFSRSGAPKNDSYDWLMGSNNMGRIGCWGADKVHCFL